jgi:hypothetical protein
MIRLIDANKLKESMLKESNWWESADIWIANIVIDKAPSVDPVKHAKWELDRNRGIICCTNCGGEKPLKYLDNGTFHIQSFPSPYCPYCGAKMDGDKK